MSSSEIRNCNQSQTTFGKISSNALAITDSHGNNYPQDGDGNLIIEGNASAFVNNWNVKQCNNINVNKTIADLIPGQSPYAGGLTIISYPAGNKLIYNSFFSNMAVDAGKEIIFDVQITGSCAIVAPQVIYGQQLYYMVEIISSTGDSAVSDPGIANVTFISPVANTGASVSGYSISTRVKMTLTQPIVVGSVFDIRLHNANINGGVLQFLEPTSEVVDGVPQGSNGVVPAFVPNQASVSWRRVNILN